MRQPVERRDPAEGLLGPDGQIISTEITPETWAEVTEAEKDKIAQNRKKGPS